MDWRKLNSLLVADSAVLGNMLSMFAGIEGKEAFHSGHLCYRVSPSTHRRIRQARKCVPRC